MAITVNNTTTVGGTSISGATSIDADNQFSGGETDIAAGLAGTLSTRTSDVAGVLTVASDHGIEAADVIGIASEGAFAYDATVDSITATTITFSAASGDVLPIATTAIIVSKVVEVDIAFSGDALVAMAMESTQRTLATLESSGSIDLAKELEANGLPYHWNSENGYTNPIAGDDIIKSNVYNGSISAATYNLVVAYNNA